MRVEQHHPCTDNQCAATGPRHCGLCGGPWPCRYVKREGGAS